MTTSPNVATLGGIPQLTGRQANVFATHDPDDVHVYAVSRTYEAYLTESPASQLTCTTPSATPLEGDEKLPNVMGLQLLDVQELSLEQDARKDVFPPVVPPTE